VIPPEQHGACVAPREEVLERDRLALCGLDSGEGTGASPKA